LKVLEKENLLESRMALFPANIQYPFFGKVIDHLSMLNTSSGQRLISEDTLKELNVAFVLSYGQMKEGEITDELKEKLIDALAGLARRDQTAAEALALKTTDVKLFNFLMKAKTILMPAGGGRRKTRGRRLAKRKTRGRRLAKKTRRS
jgi:hypothetical protein